MVLEEIASIYIQSRRSILGAFDGANRVPSITMTFLPVLGFLVSLAIILQQCSNAQAFVIPAENTFDKLSLPHAHERMIRNQGRGRYPVSSTQVSFEQIVSTGLVVSKGTSGVLNFNITLNAVQASVLANSDQAFMQSLSPEEQSRYLDMKKNYNGNLEVPMMEWLGVHLNGETTRRDMRRARRRQQRYYEKSAIVNELLLEQITTMVQISGTLMAEGVSIMPTTVFAFIRIARVTLDDGSTMTVLSTNPNDLTAANSCGHEAPSSMLTLDIIDLPSS
eukprot:TRINITY_DN17066_c0_g1_i1.p1 TRINITY_DN17066_c0_g1~~TRINITY_DN17066_c0_g1_i1.p1  ORF type:complete len:278 (+),score=36.44 TRINITY_DN17066_c0_g1_i1:201-1034(+)